MRMATAYKIAAAVLLFGLLLGCKQETKEESWQLAEAIPPAPSEKCLSPNSREEALFDAAAQVIELTEPGTINALNIGAEEFFGNALYRQSGPRGVPVCIPHSSIRRVANVFAKRDGFGPGGLSEYQLSLASKLPSRSAGVVQRVAEVAFSPEVYPSSIMRFTDMRPFARTVLASFGNDAVPYASKAYLEISMENSMGTGAAQIAAAGGHPDALPRIRRMIEKSLASTPANQPIPRDIRNRLYELAWSLYYAGTESGQSNIDLLHKIMSRKVEAWAPPFGSVSADPKKLCDLLVRIDGEQSAERYKYCIDKDHPFEQ